MTKGLQDPRIDRRVGILRNNYKNVLHVDELVTDMESLARGKPLIECFSNKSRDFKAMTTKEVWAIVSEDLRELRDKYSGLIQIRRPDHPLFGQNIYVSKIHLVYDLDGTTLRTRSAIFAALKDEAVEVHFK